MGCWLSGAWAEIFHLNCRDADVGIIFTWRTCLLDGKDPRRGFSRFYESTLLVDAGKVHKKSGLKLEYKIENNSIERCFFIVMTKTAKSISIRDIKLYSLNRKLNRILATDATEFKTKGKYADEKFYRTVHNVKNKARLFFGDI